MNKETEQKVINHLHRYRDVCGRITVLSKYSVGAGITINRLSEDDELQQLHSQLRGKPSYMYLSLREQAVMNAATANMERYPAGTKAQLHEVARTHSTEPLEEFRLRELERSIKRVLEARTGQAEGYDEVLDKLSELQDKIAERDNTDAVFEVMRKHNSNLVDLLQLRYVENRQVDDVIAAFNIAPATYRRWREKAIEEFAKLAVM
ncbi:RNA polymerase subunit sigma-24 [Paenibacillus kandeliae]|uniref:RNA polymerase subunit sigma-24 n=1 Tax=Paenibacillus kandeliae TaxID=3231269 RepID=UPI0034575659